MRRSAVGILAVVLLGYVGSSILLSTSAAPHLPGFFNYWIGRRLLANGEADFALGRFDLALRGSGVPEDVRLYQIQARLQSFCGTDKANIVQAMIEDTFVSRPELESLPLAHLVKKQAAALFLHTAKQLDDKSSGDALVASKWRELAARLDPSAK